MEFLQCVVSVALIFGIIIFLYLLQEKQIASLKAENNLLKSERDIAVETRQKALNKRNDLLKEVESLEAEIRALKGIESEV